MKNLYNRLAALAAVWVLFGTALVATPAAAGDGAPAGVVNINDASLAQLQLLPGIGLAKAKAIVEYRSRQRFGSADDLVKVRGIGKKLFEKIRSRVVVEGKTTAEARSKKTRRKK